MASRIRSIKPEFFLHEKLYTAEKKSKLPLRVAFAGLWTVADREGRFKWKTPELKFQILPHDKVDFDRVLKSLDESGFIKKYSVDGKEYGYIPSWFDHQRIRPDEAKSVLPAPPVTTRVNPSEPVTNPPESTTTRIVEGKGRERIVCVSAAVAEIFGRSFEPDPNNRMPDLMRWYSDVEEQAAKIINVYGDDAEKQVRGYMKYCKSNHRKVIGTVWKIASTVIESNWLALNSTEKVPKNFDPYAEARYNKTLLTENAWLEMYSKQIRTDEGFKKAFQITPI